MNEWMNGRAIGHGRDGRKKRMREGPVDGGKGSVEGGRRCFEGRPPAVAAAVEEEAANSSRH